MTEPPKSDKERFAKLFGELDIDKDGRVSVSELARVIQGSGDKMQTAEKIMNKGAKGGTDGKTMSFDEFLAYVHDTEVPLKLAFRQLDRNKDNKVDAEEIQVAMKDLGVSVTLADAKKLLKHMDTDGSMKIDYEEWRDFLLFSGTSRIDEIFRYWKRASAIDIGENFVIPDDFSEDERKSGQVWKTLLAGGISGCISRTATAPLDRIKLTWQALGNKAADVGLFGTVTRMLKEGGVGSLWRGNGVNCLKIAPETAVKFQAYELYKSWFGSGGSHTVDPQVKFVSGALAGASSQTIIYPMEVLKTRMCLRKSGQYSSIFHCASKLYQENGWRIFYRGYVPNILGILPYAGIELALFETFKQAYTRVMVPPQDSPSSRNSPPPPAPVYVSVTAAALSSVCGQLCTYPLALVRTKLQAQTAGSEKVGFLKVLQNTVKHEGFSGLFRGLGPNMLKVIPAVSVSYACYDQLQILFKISK